MGQGTSSTEYPRYVLPSGRGESEYCPSNSRKPCPETRRSVTLRASGDSTASRVICERMLSRRESCDTWSITARPAPPLRTSCEMIDGMKSGNRSYDVTARHTSAAGAAMATPPLTRRLVRWTISIRKSTSQPPSRIRSARGAKGFQSPRPRADGARTMAAPSARAGLRAGGGAPHSSGAGAGANACGDKETSRAEATVI
mmetsp:Transcript_43598/g.134298  ORF Transcript_43598/g.134298 Transcript_43598/m.134298 type:complete len:200 (+) Transcript_43598:73-672(+)